MQQTGYRHAPADPDVAASVRNAAEGLEALSRQFGGLNDPDAFADALGTLEQVPDAQRESLYDTARSLCESGDFYNALPIAMHLATVDHADARFPFIAATCLQHLGQQELAVSMYAAAALAGQQEITASARLNECMRDMARAPDATQAFELRAELAAGMCAMALAGPQDARIAFRMGECLRDMNRQEDAIRAFEACVDAARADPDHRHLQAAADANLRALRASARR